MTYPDKVVVVGPPASLVGALTPTGNNTRLWQGARQSEMNSGGVLPRFSFAYKYLFAVLLFWRVSGGGGEGGRGCLFVYLSVCSFFSLLLLCHQSSCQTTDLLSRRPVTDLSSVSLLQICYQSSCYWSVISRPVKSLICHYAVLLLICHRSPRYWSAHQSSCYWSVIGLPVTDLPSVVLLLICHQSSCYWSLIGRPVIDLSSVVLLLICHQSCYWSVIGRLVTDLSSVVLLFICHQSSCYWSVISPPPIDLPSDVWCLRYAPTNTILKLFQVVCNTLNSVGTGYRLSDCEGGEEGEGRGGGHWLLLSVLKQAMPISRIC